MATEGSVTRVGVSVPTVGETVAALKTGVHKPAPECDALNPIRDENGDPVPLGTWNCQQIADYFRASGQDNFADNLEAGPQDYAWMDLKCDLGYDSEKRVWDNKRPSKDVLALWKLGRNWRGVRLCMMKMDEDYTETNPENGARKQLIKWESSVTTDIIDVTNSVFDWESSTEVVDVSFHKGVLGKDFDEYMTTTLAPLGIEDKGKAHDSTKRLKAILVAKKAECQGRVVIDQAWCSEQPQPNGNSHANYLVYYIKRTGDVVKGKVDKCVFDFIIISYKCEFRMTPTQLKTFTKRHKFSILWGLFGTWESANTTSVPIFKMSQEQRDTLDVFFKARALRMWKSIGMLGSADWKAIRSDGKGKCSPRKK